MSTVYLGLGSNIEPEKNLRLAVDRLRSRFGELVLSNVYQSKALGFSGDDFLNLVARIDTDLPVADLVAALDAIHDESGRESGCAKFVARPLDIDLLLYDQLVDDKPPARVPRADVLEYSFVLVPLAGIAPDYVHPVTGRSIADHRADFDESSHPLTIIDLLL
jgi:2-amino-4-hydroxy-6-hydroxymethyldihydropteridine diphosphokinase